MQEFDKGYGPAWHCIVGSSFGSFVTHSTGCFIYFSMDKLYILLFKTKVRPASPHWFSFFLSFLFFFLHIVFPLFLFRMSPIPIIFKKPTVNSLLLCYHNVGTTIQALVLFVGRVCLDYVLIDMRACVQQKKSLGLCIPSKIWNRVQKPE